MKKREEILNLLERNAKLTAAEIAVMIDRPVEEVEATIALLEDSNIILGYKALINWEKTADVPVTALIEVRVTPQRDQGFDSIAQRICSFPQVKDCYLMSGGFDLMVTIEDASLKEVATFVSEKIAPLDAVVSTGTHFILKKYKMNGTEFSDKDDDLREAVVL
ncbi:MAG: Lrp/AsnC family transcriptional regulator [Saccharofermentanales bacterium]|jgi:DNA-binding Lrp family transcriptional regulator|nr:Lrp/AsnC family transcriptional regulator [Clostridiaceae bacterium]